MMKARDVAEVLWNFVQASFMDFPESERAPVALEFEEPLFAMLGSTGSVTAGEMTMLPAGIKSLAYLLLTQYIVFLTRFDHLTFPPGFLHGSSSTELSGQLLEYICEHRWPFPQELPW